MRATRRLGAAVAILILSTVGTTTAAPSQAELEAAEARLMEIEKEFETVVEEYNLANERLQDIEAEMATKQLVVRGVERRMETKQNAAVALAVELYKAGPQTVALESVLGADSIGDLETRVEYLRSSNEAQSKVFEVLDVDARELDLRLRELDEAKQEALAVQTRLDALRADIELKVEAQRDEIDELNAALARAEARARAALAAEASSGVFATGGVPPNPAPAPDPRAQRAVDAALSQIGKPYQWGAAGPDSYDCSGLTMWAWAKAGVSLPHNSGAQYNATPRVARSDIAPGDLLFFGSPIHHVGMYIGNGQMVEAPYSGNRVRVVPISRSDYVGAGRPGV